jgi:predicted NBD/HSP70 family sugar kinase
MVTVFRPPVMSRPILDTEDLIDHLLPMLQTHLANEVSRVYYGDIGVYLPSHFLGPRKEQRVVLALEPAYDRLMEGSRVAHQETRLIGVDIIALVNITPYFEAQPTEAYGERQLSDVMRKIRTYLTQQVNSNLGGRTQFFSVGDIQWSWAQRNNLSLRGAVLTVEARVKIDRRDANA